MTDLRQQSEQHEIQQQGHDNVGLVRPQNRNEIGFFQKYFTKSNAKKVGIIILASLLIFFSISMLLSKQTIFGRDPIKMIDNSASQIGCPQQSSFRSFYYFHELMKMIRDEKLADDKFLRWKMEEKKIEDITFYQAQKLFKVMKTIQLSRDFANSEDNNDKYSVQQKYINRLNDQTNLTQFFPEAANQYSCASCYAFPVTATIQALYKKIKNVTIKLSEQQIIDCIYDNPLINTCEEGNMTKAFQYAMNVGLVQEKYYHYRSIEGVSFPCKKQIVDDNTIPKYKISDFQVLPKGACNGIQQFLQRGYPVASMINAQKLSQFNNKKDLIFSECNKYTLNHAVVIVGQINQNKIKKGQDNKQTQQSQQQDKNMVWIVRNSWGSSFGNNGYFYMAGKNKCGTCSQSIIPYLKFNEHEQVVRGGQMPQQI